MWWRCVPVALSPCMRVGLRPVGTLRTAHCSVPASVRTSCCVIMMCTAARLTVSVSQVTIQTLVIPRGLAAMLQTLRSWVLALVRICCCVPVALSLFWLEVQRLVGVLQTAHCWVPASVRTSCCVQSYHSSRSDRSPSVFLWGRSVALGTLPWPSTQII